MVDPIQDMSHVPHDDEPQVFLLAGQWDKDTMLSIAKRYLSKKLDEEESRKFFEHYSFECIQNFLAESSLKYVKSTILVKDSKETWESFCKAMADCNDGVIEEMRGPIRRIPEIIDEQQGDSE